MPTATWNGAVIAEAEDDEVELVEGNVYFPPDKVDKTFLRDSATHTVCGWKGTASYYDIVVNGDVNKDALASSRPRTNCNPGRAVRRRLSSPRTAKNTSRTARLAA